ncbi:MAG: C10 family peptidase [Muribaculaceae bacterium]|nr:C10 family peptidase [Muribaculaceae bacterium]
MKKLLFLMAACALFAHNGDAKMVTLDQAMTIAQQYGTTNNMLKSSNASLKVAHVARNLKGATDYYVFNRDGGEGFVIVAGDDLSTPVLGYSNKGAFDINEVPEPMLEMLKEYQNRMAWVRLHPEDAQAPLITYDLQPYGVLPICGDVHWHQFPPYNNNCPASSHALTSNGRCYAGCVPVAFSTIMKGLRYPSRGFGQNSYSFMLDGKEVTVSAKFDDYSYNYSNMKNGYGETAYNAQAVSELVYEVGVAFHTIYSGESSDALLRNVFRGIITYFNYNANIQYVQKSSYSYNVQAWYDMMYNEIDNGRPIYYMGYRTISNEGNQCHVGHAFVLDGYDKDGKVHVNWGFQPEEYNTYFDFTLLSPRSNYDYDPYDSGFNADQAAIIGLCPDTTGIGGVVVKNVNLVADTMPANDLRATIDVQSLGGTWNGTLRYGIVSMNSDGSYSPVISKTATNVEIDDNGIATLDLSGDYANYYLTNGRTYYIVVWTPYFANSYDWNWFLDDPVPFTVGDWVTPPDPQFLLGDVNNDGLVNISDVTALINLLLKGADYLEAADMNQDGIMNISDVTALINYLLKNPTTGE